MRLSEKFVRLIIRLPHGEEFVRTHGGYEIKGGILPVAPAIVFLDANDKVIGTVGLQKASAADVLKEMQRHAK